MHLKVLVFLLADSYMIGFVSKYFTHIITAENVKKQKQTKTALMFHDFIFPPPFETD